MEVKSSNITAELIISSLQFFARSKSFDVLCVSWCEKALGQGELPYVSQ